MSIMVIDTRRQWPESIHEMEIKKIPNLNELANVKFTTLIFVHYTDIRASGWEIIVKEFNKNKKCSIVIYSGDVNSVKFIRNKYIDKISKEASKRVVFYLRNVERGANPLSVFGEAIQGWVKGSSISAAFDSVEKDAEENEKQRTIINSFKVLLDVSLFMLCNDHPVFRLIPPDIRERAKETIRINRDIWKKYWDPLNKEILAVDLKNACVDDKMKDICECMRHMKERFKKGKLVPDINANCIRKYIENLKEC